MFVDWICFLYFSLVGTPVSLKWSWDATCFSASCIRILSGLEECSLNTFLKRCRCFSESLKQNKNKDFVTQRASDTLSREDTVSRNGVKGKLKHCLDMEAEIETITLFLPISERTVEQSGL